MIAVLHDLDQVREHFPTSLLLARSCIAWGETASVLTNGQSDARPQDPAGAADNPGLG